jgi:hypothetical protein
MRTHFGEEFRLLLPSDFPALRRVAGQDNGEFDPGHVCDVSGVLLILAIANII